MPYALCIWHKAAFSLYPPAGALQQNYLPEIKRFGINSINRFENVPVTALTSSDMSSDDIPSCSSLSLQISPIPQTSVVNFLFSGTLTESGITLKTTEQEVERYVISWRENNSRNYSLLSKLALKIHSIPAISAAADRAFSLAGNIITEKRNRLGPKRVDNLIFLHSFQKKIE